PVAPHWPSILLHAPATSLTFTLSLRDALPISQIAVFGFVLAAWMVSLCLHEFGHAYLAYRSGDRSVASKGYLTLNPFKYSDAVLDRKSTRLNSSHVKISYAVFCLKKKEHRGEH